MARICEECQKAMPHDWHATTCMDCDVNNAPDHHSYIRACWKRQRGDKDCDARGRFIHEEKRVSFIPYRLDAEQLAKEDFIERTEVPDDIEFQMPGGECGYFLKQSIFTRKTTWNLTKRRTWKPQQQRTYAEYLQLKHCNETLQMSAIEYDNTEAPWELRRNSGSVLRYTEDDAITDCDHMKGGKIRKDRYRDGEREVDIELSYCLDCHTFSDERFWDVNIEQMHFADIALQQLCFRPETLEEEHDDTTEESTATTRVEQQRLHMVRTTTA